MTSSLSTTPLTNNIGNRTPADRSASVVWFRRLMWLGIAGNFVIAIVSLTWPTMVLEFLGLEPASPLVWPRFSALLLILLTIFYIPSAIDPLHHRYSAYGALLARFGGVVFFLLVGGRYILFGLYDFVFGFPQAILLLLALRRHRTR
jgi:hypothetical protein